MSYVWNSAEFEKKLKENLPGVETEKLDDGHPGGDWDLFSIGVSRNPVGDCVVITPFMERRGPGNREFYSKNEDGTWIFEPDGAEVVTFEVRNANSDSRGGCNSDYPETHKIYGEVLNFIENVIGVRTVSHYEELY